MRGPSWKRFGKHSIEMFGRFKVLPFRLVPVDIYDCDIEIKSGGIDDWGKCRKWLISMRILAPKVTLGRSILERMWFLLVSKHKCSPKHRKNCECCHHHSVFKGYNVNVNIAVLNCQKCNQCLKCQVSGHKCLGLIFESVL